MKRLDLDEVLSDCDSANDALRYVLKAAFDEGSIERAVARDGAGMIEQSLSGLGDFFSALQSQLRQAMEDVRATSGAQP